MGCKDEFQISSAVKREKYVSPLNLKKLSSEIIFLYFHEKNLLIGFLVQLEGHRSDWDYSKDGLVMPNEITSGANIKMFWKCRLCGAEWSCYLSNRTSKGRGCPNCKRLSRD